MMTLAYMAIEVPMPDPVIRLNAPLEGRYTIGSYAWAAWWITR